jgi:gamma-glutamylcyclotransferase (GGCT)/AIG2-like uncharacterized protein YtfP
MTDLLFVYGTLRRGHGNHRLVAGCFVAEAVTVEPFAMDGVGVPKCHRTARHPAWLRPVVGELMRVDAPTLKRVDRLEGHPDWYRRERVQVVRRDLHVPGGFVSTVAETAWMYVMRGKCMEVSPERVDTAGCWDWTVGMHGNS